jgi:hypothetical protein
MASNELHSSGKLSPEELAKAQREIDERPRALPLDKRAWPYGRPDRFKDKV